jgi:DNA phosphorothioation-dependent restriction protein DptH
MHRIASWVLCLDPSVDERLIQKGSADAQSGDKREIIGFASGVGAHGELNYTLSTERASLLDVQNMIRKKVNNLFGPWEPADAENAARFLVREARELSGISLVRATGRGEQVRDLIAYALVRRCLAEAGNDGPAPLCDELVVLDAFPHWFENIGGGREMYPDLLRVSASLAEDGLIDVDATLMECKISSDVNRHIQKARSQVENGLRHLVARFMPKADASDPPVSQIGGSSPIFRFDQRYWWAQLQRLIANKAVVETSELESATAALESLGEGRFRIQWKAAALTIWTESDAPYNSDVFQTVEVWPFQQEGRQIAIPLISCGGDLIRRIGGGNHPVVLPLEPPDPPTAPVQWKAHCQVHPVGIRVPDFQLRPPGKTMQPARPKAQGEGRRDDGRRRSAG